MRPPTTVQLALDASPTAHPAHRRRAGSLIALALLLLIGGSGWGCAEGDVRGGEPRARGVAELEGEVVGPDPRQRREHLEEHGLVASSEPLPERVQEKMDELVRLFTPLPLDLTSDILDARFRESQAYLAQMMEDERETGLAALRTYAEYDGEFTGIRRALLMVAGYAAPEDSKELLAHLFVHYGHDIDDRTYASEVLANTSPETYIEIAHKYLIRKGRPSKTMPADEFLVRGWVDACEALGRSPVDVLADVVTNLMMEDAARHYAAEVLGRYPEPLGRKALETALIESTGNGYIRRKAAQALLASIPREDVCTLLRSVIEKEADINFAYFLRDMIDRNCH